MWSAFHVYLHQTSQAIQLEKEFRRHRELFFYAHQQMVREGYNLFSNAELSLVDLLQCCALIGRELQSVELFSCTERSYYRGPLRANSDATPAVLCHKEPAGRKKYP